MALRRRQGPLDNTDREIAGEIFHDPAYYLGEGDEGAFKDDLVESLSKGLGIAPRRVKQSLGRLVRLGVLRTFLQEGEEVIAATPKAAMVGIDHRGRPDSEHEINPSRPFDLKDLSKATRTSLARNISTESIRGLSKLSPIIDKADRPRN